MPQSLQALEPLFKNDDKLNVFHIGDVILPSPSDLLKIDENRQERNFATDDCGSISSDGVNSNDDSTNEYNQKEQRVPNSPIHNHDPYCYKRMKQRQDAVIKIQHFWRVNKTRTQSRDLASYMVKMEEKIGGFSATLVQTQWRKYVALKRYRMYLWAVIVLQSTARAKPARKLLRHNTEVKDAILKTASTRIQRITRGYITRSEYNLKKIVNRIILCQSIVRRFLAIETLYTLSQLQALLQIISARKIQFAYRNYKNGSTLTRRLLNQHRENYGDYGEQDIDNTLVYIVDNEEVDYESKCCEHSRCGLADEVHAMLIESGRWFYNKLGDPDVDTAENLITVMEISEEATFCCWRHSTAPSGRKLGPAKLVGNETRRVGKSSVVLIQ
ncbi:hypothetical protein HJC23_013688 [Cyclotella cryptica]|uniref:Uncharacterized protein n=1 Tax=Cyclotella cryptica TaxID=29204 RepID=A0ABD3QVE4_9STRA|eukprot:CCRYP_001535-RA/>CCRYP_001535-RA protein AED:0.21 eAED:0.21 QI:0/-1/0/1/-1/1/1/0/385